MTKKARIIFSCTCVVLLTKCEAFGYLLQDTQDFSLEMGTYLRTDLISFKNVVDLDSANKDDSTTYLGIDYSLSFNSIFQEVDTNFYLKLERNGPFDYDAPLFVHNTLMTSSGTIERYRKEELLPQLEEVWLDMPISGFRFKPGLYTYEVGNGLSLNGSYENVGFSLSKAWNNSIWRFYYCRPDLVYKNRLGPRIRQEQEQGIGYKANASNFFAVDAKLEAGENCFNPYIGALVDYTSRDKRDNTFSSPIKEDVLGTLGLNWKGKLDKLDFNFEAAHNFGKGISSDPEFKDVYHTGYLFFGDLDYHLGKITPSLQFLFCSGNKVTPEMAQNQDQTLSSGKNRAFSYMSPLNKNFSDSISGVNSEIRPILAMGAGDGLNYGIARPETFYASDFDNLIMSSASLSFQVSEKLSVGLYGYYLLSFTRGVGMFEGKAKYLSRELGSEVDTSIEYNLNKNISLSLFTAVFFPGDFYKEKRDDISGSLLTPFVRGDGLADTAYQIELAAEFKF